MKFLHARVAAALTVAFAASAHAAPIPYATPGVESNAEYEFIAASTGNVFAYFAGSIANNTNEIALLVNGVDSGIQGLNNHRANYGDMLDFGLVSAGDRMVFKLINMDPDPVGPFYSDRSLNGDQRNHIYSASYNGDAFIPKGIAVGFEDLPNGGDFDYNDENFVFVNVANAIEVSEVPEPASIALLLSGVAAIGANRRARKA